ncbi:MAG: transposase [Bryobacterales bacterium]|nr:transposase [Bryobacterales bacterium]
MLHLRQLDQVTVSPNLISLVTDAVSDKASKWRTRPSDPGSPVFILDALRALIRDEGTVCNKAVYLGLRIRMDGTKEVLGLCVEQNEGARLLQKVMNELETRGVRDCLIAVVDGLKGFLQAIRSAFPKAQVQTRTVDLMRHTLRLCSFKDRRQMAWHMK